MGRISIMEGPPLGRPLWPQDIAEIFLWWFVISALLHIIWLCCSTWAHKTCWVSLEQLLWGQTLVPPDPYRCCRVECGVNNLSTMNSFLFQKRIICFASKEAQGRTEKHSLNIWSWMSSSKIWNQTFFFQFIEFIWLKGMQTHFVDIRW